MREPFDRVGARIYDHAGQPFRTIRGLPFSYRADSGAIYPTRTCYRLARADVEHAYHLAPLPGPGSINGIVRGPAYIWAALHDSRISLNQW